MKQNTIDCYNEMKYNWRKFGFRLGVGLQQIRCRPWYYLLFFPVLFVFGITWQGRKYLFSGGFIPKKILDLFMSVTSVLLILILILFMIAMIKQFGLWASRDWEGKLVLAFKDNDNNLKNWEYPILISLKHGENGILILEFYSNIHIKRWRELKQEIEEKTNLNIRAIEYGGKDKSKGNHKVIYAIPEGNRNNAVLHDEALDRELENVD